MKSRSSSATVNPSMTSSTRLSSASVPSRTIGGSARSRMGSKWAMEVTAHGTISCRTPTHRAPADAPAASVSARHWPLASTTSKCSRTTSELKKSRRKGSGSILWKGRVYRKRCTRLFPARSHFLRYDRTSASTNAPVVGSGSFTNAVGSASDPSFAIASADRSNRSRAARGQESTTGKIVYSLTQHRSSRAPILSHQTARPTSRPERSVPRKSPSHHLRTTTFEHPSSSSKPLDPIPSEEPPGTVVQPRRVELPRGARARHRRRASQRRE